LVIVNYEGDCYGSRDYLQPKVVRICSVNIIMHAIVVIAQCIPF